MLHWLEVDSECWFEVSLDRVLDHGIRLIVSSEAKRCGETLGKIEREREGVLARVGNSSREVEHADSIFNDLVLAFVLHLSELASLLSALVDLHTLRLLPFCLLLSLYLNVQALCGKRHREVQVDVTCDRLCGPRHVVRLVSLKENVTVVKLVFGFYTAH